MSELFPLLAQGRARLIVDRVIPMSQVAQAHEHLSNRGTRGKVILTP
jgi:NADPH:quinone reductase-like Zn-dependent oxidoreductase